MVERIAIDVGGRQVLFELSPGEESGLPAAGADEAVAVTHVSRTLDQSLGVFGALARRFADVFDSQHVASAEISMGLKVTAKGDFVVVRSNGDASLVLKLTMRSKGGEP
jgi:hypothetical protein